MCFSDVVFQMYITIELLHMIPLLKQVLTATFWQSVAITTRVQPLTTVFKYSVPLLKTL